MVQSQGLIDGVASIASCGCVGCFLDESVPDASQLDQHFLLEGLKVVLLLLGNCMHTNVLSCSSTARLSAVFSIN